MNCSKCKKPIGECECPDIDERMAELRNNPNFIYKMCKICGKHYERCKCENPVWITSHDGVSLEDALKQPTLADKISNKTNQASAKRAIPAEEIEAELRNLFGRKLNKVSGNTTAKEAPPELKEAFDVLEKAGIKVCILKPEFITEASKMDILSFEAYKKMGGKLN